MKKFCFVVFVLLVVSGFTIDFKKEYILDNAIKVFQNIKNEEEKLKAGKKIVDGLLYSEYYDEAYDFIKKNIKEGEKEPLIIKCFETAAENKKIDKAKEIADKLEDEQDIIELCKITAEKGYYTLTIELISNITKKTYKVEALFETAEIILTKDEIKGKEFINKALEINDTIKNELDRITGLNKLSYVLWESEMIKDYIKRADELYSLSLKMPEGESTHKLEVLRNLMHIYQKSGEQEKVKKVKTEIEINAQKLLVFYKKSGDEDDLNSFINTYIMTYAFNGDFEKAINLLDLYKDEDAANDSFLAVVEQMYACNENEKALITLKKFYEKLRSIKDKNKKYGKIYYLCEIERLLTENSENKDSVILINNILDEIDILNYSDNKIEFLKDHVYNILKSLKSKKIIDSIEEERLLTKIDNIISKINKRKTGEALYYFFRYFQSCGQPENIIKRFTDKYPDYTDDFNNILAQSFLKVNQPLKAKEISLKIKCDDCRNDIITSIIDYYDMEKDYENSYNLIEQNIEFAMKEYSDEKRIEYLLYYDYYLKNTGRFNNKIIQTKIEKAYIEYSKNKFQTDYTYTHYSDNGINIEEYDKYTMHKISDCIDSKNEYLLSLYYITYRDGSQPKYLVQLIYEGKKTPDIKKLVFRTSTGDFEVEGKKLQHKYHDGENGRKREEILINVDESAIIGITFSKTLKIGARTKTGILKFEVNEKTLDKYREFFYVCIKNEEEFLNSTKNSIFQQYEGIKFEEAFSDFFINPKWEFCERNIVSFTGIINKNGDNKEIRIDFVFTSLNEQSMMFYASNKRMTAEEEDELIKDICKK